VGIPYLGIGLAGFYSKDAIINSAFAAHSGIGSYAFTLLIVSAGMTSFYSWRQFLMTFHGRYRGSDMDPHEMHDDELHDEPLQGVEDTGHSQTHQHHLPALSEIHESPKVMLVPLGLLRWARCSPAWHSAISSSAKARMNSGRRLSSSAARKASCRYGSSWRP